MKALNYLTVLALFTLGSCSSSLYTGVENDDLYFTPSDRAVVAKARKPADRQVVEGNLKSDDYYDNIYAADTLVSDEYSNALSSGNEVINNYNGGYFNNYDFDTYSGRLRRFYGNSFYPYWRDPFYFSYGMGMPFGYGTFGSPYSFYDPYYYDPYFYDPYSYYGGWNSGYYPGYYYGSGLGFGYNPFYMGYYSSFSPWGMGSYSYLRYGSNDNGGVTYARRERQSVYSTKWNSSVPTSSAARRDNYVSKGVSDATRRSYSENSPDARRSTSIVNTRQALTGPVSKSGQDVNRTQNASTRTDAPRTTVVTRPEYNSVNRSYTPSYNNPRMSSRPSYNNSRVSGTQSDINRSGNTYNNSRSGSGSSGVRTPSYSESYRYGGNSSRTNTPSSVSAGQSRSSSYGSYSSGSTYAAPSRRSVESGSYSSGSFNSGSSRSSTSSSYSSGSYGSSRSSGSYSSGGGSSYSGGSSSSSSGSSGGGGSSSGGSSSGGRR